METEAAWAVVELMGHVRLAGRLTEEEKFGSKMGRLDIPRVRQCSDASDNWCPVCGTCTCPKTEDPASGKDDPGCKLHAPNSPHGEEPEYTTQLFSGASVYRITFVAEEVARRIAQTASDVAPVKPWELPKAIAGRPTTEDIPFDGTDDRDF